MKTIFEAQVQIRGEYYYGYSYEKALFALNDLINKLIDKKIKLSVKKDILVTQKEECPATGMLYWNTGNLFIKDTYNFLHDLLTNNNL
jgi:hypothetical protein